WGRAAPRGPIEQARQRSAQRQAAVVMLRVPSNTTIVGEGAQAALVNGGLMLDGVDNVIVRNLHLSDAYDHFPAWDPDDGRQGAWNSAYDTLMLRSATHVWIDHCTLDDGERPDAAEPIRLGQPVQRHDGLLDIVRQSNWVTVSWNHFRHHDKTMLIGNSDAQAADAGRLKVSLHHNWFEGVRERTPRVRYGQVHIYNNLFEALPDNRYGYAYSIGIGHESRVVSAHNAWVTPPAIAPRQLVRALGGHRFTDSGSTHNAVPVDLLAALRAASPGVSWSADVGWTPEHWLSVDSAATVPARVRAGAGAGRWASPALAGTP
ncbi:MAG: pectate lyase, partial [Burkholderiaceae bacterium]|nr:pectate lyase [Burkholderiaceae bacterium]